MAGTNEAVGFAAGLGFVSVVAIVEAANANARADAAVAEKAKAEARAESERWARIGAGVANSMRRATLENRIAFLERENAALQEQLREAQSTPRAYIVIDDRGDRTDN